MSKRGFLVLGLLAALLVTPGAIANHEGPGEPREQALLKLFGTAQDDVDPENSFNEVISVDTTTGARGGVFREMRVKIATLDNQLEGKYFFLNRTCGGAGPRITLLVSVDNDPQREFALDGFFGPAPSFTGCPPNKWTYEDLTDDLPRWDVRPLVTDLPPLPAGFPQPNVYVPWDVVEAAITTTFPEHWVVRGSLIDDSGSFFLPARGCAYYDMVSIGARTLSDWDDTRKHHPDLPNAC